MNMLETYISTILEQRTYESPSSLGLAVLGSSSKPLLVFVDPSLNPDSDGFIVGMIQLELHQSDCYGAYEVTEVVSLSSGMGKHLYGAARTYAAKKGRPIVPSRNEIEPRAATIWKYIFDTTEHRNRLKLNDELDMGNHDPKTESSLHGIEWLDHAYRGGGMPMGMYDEMVDRWLAIEDRQSVDVRYLERQAKSLFHSAYASLSA